MVEVHERRPSPWMWVSIVLMALILVLVVWWVVSAQQSQTAVVPSPSQPTTPTPQQPGQPGQPGQPTQPTQPAQPSQPSPPSQPVVVQPQQPVNIYINTKTQTPQVYVVPKGQQPPSSAQNAQRVSLPAAFKYDGKVWNASDQAVTTNTAKLKEIGEAVNGNPLYTDQNAEPPYTVLYMETSAGSGVFLRYDQSG